ncbi:hypothetical protein FNW02_00170 [Komarekiella sp. 'clone 1']|uniref:Uncharacterized protein n=1 Tax=Komarekiella delphini-convector SJRDD-AB1 TaxID=2593771 RepID=A0AA40SSE4_9NOST|nr:hypothetical protein [Komarekiella delphini-convector SJRDD-AB1]
MAQWKQLRILLLALTLGSVLLVFIKVFLTKAPNKPKPEESRVKANIISLFKDYQTPVDSIPIHFWSTLFFESKY